MKVVLVGLFVILAIGLSETHPINEENLDNFIDKDVDESDLIDYVYFARSLYGTPDNTTGSRLENYNPETDNANPEELGSYLEGDMLIPGSSHDRNGLLSQIYRWKDGVVPYEIKGTFNSREKGVIENGIRDFHRNTCIRFVPRTTERDYISIISENTGCWSSVGRMGGRQEVNLQSPACLSKRGTFLHEITHALGFMHEQNRYERDSYIAIHFDNIQQKFFHNFDKASSATTYGFGVPYDYGSVMHYSAYAFSINGKATITPKVKTSVNIGQRVGFSSRDIMKINSMYRCGIKQAKIMTQ